MALLALSSKRAIALCVRPTPADAAPPLPFPPLLVLVLVLLLLVLLLLLLLLVVVVLLLLFSCGMASTCPLKGDPLMHAYTRLAWLDHWHPLILPPKHV